MTIKDIAKMAGVSKGTVSRIINNIPDGVSEATRKNILEIIERVGYVPNRVARSITVSETRAIGLIIPDVQNPFFPQLVRGIEDCAMENGYTVFLCNSDSDIEKEQKYLYTFLEKRVDGIIVNTCGELNDKRLNMAIRNSGTPVILLDRKTDYFKEYPGVYIDNRQAAFDGGCFLLKSGAKHVAFLGGQEFLYTTEERCRGYRMAHEHFGITENEDLISYGEYSMDSGYTRTIELMKKHPYTDAIFAGSDVIALGVLKALRLLGVDVPGCVQVLGFDNIAISEVIYPTLSTVSQPIYEEGYCAAQKLIDSIINKDVRQNDEYLVTKLVLRESTRGEV